ncbi:hypothetical protein G2W53_032943 [Senna tora]|uniref:Uncharacterized protein n=1 Tax=Senna tora TaxID=362788 RepID=A0A834T1B9_9FABA|nr:hypothetical protein G2W53_032943 [Senna tora]
MGTQSRGSSISTITLTTEEEEQPTTASGKRYSLVSQTLSSSRQGESHLLQETILGQSEEDLRLIAPSKKFILEGYLNWTIHGEKAWGGEGSAFNDADDDEDTRNPNVDMVVDTARGRLIRS